VAAADVATATSQGQPVKAFARMNTGVIYLMVLDKDIADQRGITAKMTIEEKGRAIKGLILAGTSPGSGTDYAMRYVLRKAGLDPDRDVEITYVGSAAAMLPAFEQRVVNTMITSDPATVLGPVTKGTAIVLFDFIGGEVPGTKEVLGALAVAHRDELESRPELFEAFVRGLWRGMRFIGEQEAAAKELVSKAYFPEMDPTLYQMAWDLNRAAWSKEPTITEAQLKATLDYRNATAPPPPLDVKFGDFATNRFVEAAKKQLGF
ncbi:MAG: ABC transporter substrate-binding protein, partial [Chloroflexi bacterium]|nr:ABC transporter substrate-binding protein [Chloroflexota bacterium]